MTKVTKVTGAGFPRWRLIGTSAETHRAAWPLPEAANSGSSAVRLPCPVQNDTRDTVSSRQADDEEGHMRAVTRQSAAAGLL